MGAMRHVLLLVAGTAFLTAAAGCGGASPRVATSAAPPATAAAPATASSSPSPLQAEATAIAGGDIPDNQVFLRFTSAASHYSLKYPEGWAERASGSTTTFRDKNNVIRIVVVSGAPVTLAQASRDVSGINGAQIAAPPQRLVLGGKAAVKVVYTTESAPNPVTGKRLTLTVDRYYLWHAGRRAVVDLGTPVGVDNVDAYRLMIESFRWS